MTISKDKPDSADRTGSSDDGAAKSSDLNTQGPNDQTFDPAKLLLLFNASKALASTTNLDQLLDIIVAEVQTIIECDGAGVLLYDEEKDDFYWRTVSDKQSFLASASDTIRIPKDRGVCGWVFNHGTPALVHDAATDPRLYREVDTKSGFRTRNMVCTPLQSGEKSLGVLYALNKTVGNFSEHDVEILMALSSNVALALENASFLERLTNSNVELQRLNRAKDKMLHHLSHELKTPIAIVDATLSVIKKKLEKAGLDPQRFPFERVTRNLDRLKTIEQQVMHILDGKDYTEKKVSEAFLDYIEDFLEIQEDEQPQLSLALKGIRQRIMGIFPSEKTDTEPCEIAETLEKEKSYVKTMLLDRNIDILFEKSARMLVNLPSHIVTSLIRGILRNAVENTPDMGRIEVRARETDEGAEIVIKDYGVGIPADDQPNIFEGFYPVQETELYSSGRPYGFNAGGSGTDLLKLKIFSNRLGFKISFKSSRCSCIPTSSDVCPGSIDKCACCNTLDDCLNNGGTEFVVQIPSNLIVGSDV